MTTFDLGVSAFIVLGIIFGSITGAMRQVVQLLAWAAAVGASYAFTAQAAEQFQKPLGLPYALAYPLCGVALWVGAYLAVRILLGVLMPKPEDGSDGSWLVMSNRLLGGLFGGLKAALVAWALLSLLATFQSLIAGQGHSLAFAKGSFLDAARTHNACEALFKDRLDRLQATLVRLRSAPRASPPEELKELAADERVQRLIDNVRVLKELETGNPGALLSSEDALKVMSDRKLVEKLLAAATGAAASPPPSAPPSAPTPAAPAEAPQKPADPLPSEAEAPTVSP